MQPVRLLIPGEWWDSYIYAGHLYLLRADGSAKVIRWPSLINEIVERYALDRLAVELAFVDARYLYGDQWARLVRDPEIRAVLDSKFERLSSDTLEIDDALLEAVGAYDVPAIAPELVSDVEIHRDMMYFGGEAGLFIQSRHALDGPGSRIWDAPLYRIRASEGVLALAAGVDGLFQVAAQRRREVESIADLAPLVYGDFFSCGWLARNIYATSYANAGMLAYFNDRPSRRGGSRQRVFEAAVPDSAVFHDASDDWPAPSGSNGRHRATEADQSDAPPDDQPPQIIFESRAQPAQARPSKSGLSWAGQDRVCQATQDGVRVAEFRPRRKRLKDKFKVHPTTALSGATQAVAGDVAPFGVVLETDEDLVVLADEGVWSYGREPIRWRTFPRATNYPNQLHIVAEDRIEICSFRTATLEDLYKPLMGRASKS